MVDYWCSDEWMAIHLDKQKWQKQMIGVAHHQGNANLHEYGKKWSKHNGVEPVGDYVAYDMAHKGSFRNAKPYDENDDASTYTSRTSFDKLVKYSKESKNKYGPDHDPSKHNLDPEVVMLAGEGKKHGIHAIRDGIISTSSHRTLPQIKARQMSSSTTSVQTRSTPAMLELEALLVEERRAADERMQMAIQAALAEERRAGEEMMHHALKTQAIQYWDMLAAMCAQQGVAPPERPTRSPITPHPSGVGSNDPASSHAQGNNNLGDSPLL